MKLITFLGTTDYKIVTYSLHDSNSEPTKFVQAALAQFIKPEKIVVLVTTEAEALHRPALEAELIAAHIPTNSISWSRIPVGKVEDDLWKIFEVLAESLDSNEEVCFDITHSFRSQPLLVLLASAYLRVAKNVRIKGIYYGALEAKCPPSLPKETQPTDNAPVFDLTPFLTLLELTQATSQFLNTGSSGELSGILKVLNPSSSLAPNLLEISQCLEMLRPNKLIESASQLKSQIEIEQENIETTVPPAGELLEQIGKEYGKFALPEIGRDATPRETVLRQYEMILWYKEKKQYVHALALSREWVVSLLCLHYQADLLNHHQRSDMETLLNGGKKQFSEERSERWEDFKQLPFRKPLMQFWTESGVANLRNDVLHAGQREKALLAEEVIVKIEGIVAGLEKIGRDWNLFDSPEHLQEHSNHENQ